MYQGTFLCFAVSICILLSACSFIGSGGSEEQTLEQSLKILDDNPKLILVNGYSTSFKWPDLLQRKLIRYYEGRECPLKVERITKGGTPISRWIDVETGEPRSPWEKIVRPGMAKAEGRPVIVLCQQSLQFIWGRGQEGIRSAEDGERIQQGTDAMDKYVRLLQKDGADLVILAVHIYKEGFEPAIENEKYALDALMKRKIPNLVRGPDVWTPSKKVHPMAFARDRKHPNSVGSEIMAQLWFEALLEHDDLEIPEWSRHEMQEAIEKGPSEAEMQPRQR